MNKTIYVVVFHWEDEFCVEGVFKTKQDAKNYIVNESVARGLYENDIWIEEFEIRTEKRMSKEELINTLKDYSMYEDYESGDEAIKDLTGWVDCI